MTYARKDTGPLWDEIKQKHKGLYRIVYAEDGKRFIVQEKLYIFWRACWVKLGYSDFKSVENAERYIDEIIEYNCIIAPQERKLKENAGKVVKYYP